MPKKTSPGAKDYSYAYPEKFQDLRFGTFAFPRRDGQGIVVESVCVVCRSSGEGQSEPFAADWYLIEHLCGGHDPNSTGMNTPMSVKYTDRAYLMPIAAKVLAKAEERVRCGQTACVMKGA